MQSSRVKLQVDTSQAVRDRAKVVAYSRGINLNELVLKALAKEGDKELTALIKKDLSERTPPGRPSSS
jgi:hypothetical protein